MPYSQRLHCQTFWLNASVLGSPVCLSFQWNHIHRCSLNSNRMHARLKNKYNEGHCIFALEIHLIFFSSSSTQNRSCFIHFALSSVKSSQYSRSKWLATVFRPCLVHSEIQKLFKLPRPIESYVTWSIKYKRKQKLIVHL